jgi:8-hydroxy-5-deazaflavin:NADPH oxidoreductase
MKAGIIGSGPVGQTLAKAFKNEGYEVLIGTRDVNKPAIKQFTTSDSGIQAGTFEDAAAFGDFVVLCVAGSAAASALDLAKPENLANKLVIDTTNPIAASKPVNGVLQFFTDANYSLMEKLQQQVPMAKFVKAFNSVGSNLMYKPSFAAGKPSMFIAGNDEEARKNVRTILDTFGFETEDMGKAEAARAIENLCILWCIPGFLKNSWGHGFKLLHPSK